MARLINTATGSGSFNGTTMVSSSVFTTYTTAIDVEKKANKTLWLDGELDYTITVLNPDDPVTGTQLLETMLRDNIDPKIASLNGDVSLNGTTLTRSADPEAPDPNEYGYNPDTGLLVVNIGTLNPGADEAAIITFQVVAVP